MPPFKMASSGTSRKVAFCALHLVSSADSSKLDPDQRYDLKEASHVLSQSGTVFQNRASLQQFPANSFQLI